MADHHCPPWCHKCPALHGDVMPVCWGSVDRNDLNRCYCKRPTASVREADSLWSTLVSRVKVLEAALGIPVSADAVDPIAQLPGTLTTREKKVSHG